MAARSFVHIACFFGSARGCSPRLVVCSYRSYTGRENINLISYLCNLQGKEHVSTARHSKKEILQRAAYHAFKAENQKI